VGGNLRRGEIIELGDASDELPRLLRRVQLQGRRPAEEGRLLSGGERNRVHMAKLLKSGGNVLLLDEPTNDLDVETLRALEDALEDFAGCAVVISHDRFFLDRLCTHILAFEGEAHVEWFEGNFEDYEEDKKRRLGPDALEPKRVKYKKFVKRRASHPRRGAAVGRRPLSFEDPSGACRTDPIGRAGPAGRTLRPDSPRCAPAAHGHAVPSFPYRMQFTAPTRAIHGRDRAQFATNLPHFRSAAWEIGGAPQQTLVFRRISAIVDKTETAGFPCPKYTTF
jgi:energy-coupling factor transporter ATP-binding protein EcfA2